MYIYAQVALCIRTASELLGAWPMTDFLSRLLLFVCPRRLGNHIGRKATETSMLRAGPVQDHWQHCY